MGRRPKALDTEAIQKLARGLLSKNQIAARLGIDPAKFKGHLAAAKALADAFDSGRELGLGDLALAQRNLALGIKVESHEKITPNPTMLIWLGKQYLGQTDTVQYANEHGDITIKVVYEDRREAVRTDDPAAVTAREAERVH